MAKCYHTKIISTSDKAKFTGATHVSFDPEHGAEIAHEIVRMAVEAFADRNQERVRIPVEPVRWMGGFSVEAILGALGGTPKPLVDAIAAGSIRGAVAVVGCNNPKLPQDLEHIELTRRLIENDILVLVTGCAAVANGKAGQMVPEAAAMAGPGLRAVCESLGIPPVLHMGSCVDNSRVMALAAALAGYLGVDIDQLPLAGAAPEWYSEKAVAIGAYVVGLRASPPCWVSSHRCSAARTWCPCWPADSTTWWVPSSWSSRTRPRPHCGSAATSRTKRRGLGLPAVDIVDDGSPGAGTPVAAGAGSEG